MTQEATVPCSLSADGGFWGDIQVRPFREEDADDLARFWREREFDISGGVYHDTKAIDGEYVLKTMKEENTIRGTIAIQHDRIVGYHEVRRSDPTVLSVCYLYIDPKLRGTGFAGNFSFVTIQYVVSRPSGSCRRMVASYSPGNRRARRLYNHLGVVEPQPGELEVLVPQMLTVPAFVRFAERHDLFASYDTFEKAVSFDVSGVERIEPKAEDRGCSDKFVWRGMAVFPQRFRVGEDWIEILVDAASLAVCYSACPEWRASLVAAPVAAEIVVAAANTGLRPLPVKLPLDRERTTLEPGQSLCMEAAVRVESDEGKQVSLPCEIGDTTVTLGATVAKKGRKRTASAAGNLDNVSSEMHAAPLLTLRNDTARAVLDVSQGGAMRSLVVSDREILKFTKDANASLGWIFPWKGGLFTILEAEPQPFRIEPWGPFPGYVGFNTMPIDCSAHRNRATRESIMDGIFEASVFNLEPDGIHLSCRLQNRLEHPVSATFALFVFLAGPEHGAPTRVRSREGTVRSSSRRSFEVGSETAVTIEGPERSISLETTTVNARVSAFNLGDEGPHFVMHSPLLLRERELVEVGGRLRIGATESSKHRRPEAR